MERVVISGGGTGGHIFPAISIANAIRERYPNAEILFVGAQDRMEMEKVPAAGYKIVGLEIAGFNRKKLWKNVAVLFKLSRSLKKAKALLKEFKPQVAIGVGGYASGPTLKAANRLGIPTVLQEQNSYAGVTNKLLGEKASRICVAYEGMERFFPANKIVMTGNPCRQDLLSEVNKDEAYEYFKLDKNKKTILIVGGSLGAGTLNQSVIAHLEDIAKSDVQFIWQCGGYYYNDLQMEMAKHHIIYNLHLHDFISRMDFAYAIADVVISRAGAGSISELSILGKPAILVPSPNVAEDHQTKNAMALVSRNAAILVKDAEAKETLIPTTIDLVHDEDRLSQLSSRISDLAEYNSANRIVDEIEKVVNGGK